MRLHPRRSGSGAGGEPGGRGRPRHGGERALELEWTTVLDLRPEAVALFGIEPEGRITHLRCSAWGQLGITQTGSDFTGTAIQTSWCVTAGGNAFDPSQAFPSSLSMEGHVQGRSLSFTVTTGVFPCPYRGRRTWRPGR